MKKEEKTKKKEGTAEIEPTTYANINKRCRMLSGGTWQLNGLERSKTVHANRKATHCNKIKGNLMKKKEIGRKKNQNECAPGMEPTTSANMNKRQRIRGEGTWHLTNLERSKTVQENKKATDCYKI